METTAVYSSIAVVPQKIYREIHELHHGVINHRDSPMHG